MRYILALFLLTATAQAQPQQLCGDRTAIVERLKTKYYEQLEFRAVLAGNKALMEIYVSASGTWTQLLSSPNGMSCFVASGDGWRAEPKKENEL